MFDPSLACPKLFPASHSFSSGKGVKESQVLAIFFPLIIFLETAELVLLGI